MSGDPMNNSKYRPNWTKVLVGWLCLVGAITHIAAVLGAVLWLFGVSR